MNRLILALLIVLASATQVIALTIQAGKPAPAPAGYTAFCRRDPDECVAAAPAVVQATKANLAFLAKVNGETNAAIAPAADIDHYGRDDYWTIPTDAKGDCEDYALAKRATLIAAGIPAGALHLAVVLANDGERHVVLDVTTSDGDLVLDNLQNVVLPWNLAGFIWLERQVGGGWEELDMIP